MTPDRPLQRPQFFLAPESPLQRQYEALRCFFVEGLPSQQVATRFGYSPGAFRVLCHQFRHDPSKRARFFQAIRRGPQAAPARDRVRELAVALRKRNLSVYDIQRELAAALRRSRMSACDKLSTYSCHSRSRFH